MQPMPSKEAIDLYNFFKTLPGAQHIGKPVSIDALIAMCRELKPVRVLEMGGGIGALSYTVLKYSNAFLDVYEDNEFCIAELKKNLREFEGRYEIITTYRMLPPERVYDIAVIDGGTGATKDGGYPLAARLFLLYLERVRAVYIEGYRGLQRDSARHALRERFRLRFKIYKEVWNGDQKWPGGLRINCITTHSAFLRAVDFYFWELLVYIRRFVGSVRTWFRRFR